VSPWYDFWPKVALAVLNSVALGGAALLAGYSLNRRLERHKRNEAITAELGKQSVAAYLRTLAVIGEINGYMVFAELAAHQEQPRHDPKREKQAQQHPFGDTDQALAAAFREVFKNTSLVNSTFAAAAVGFLGFASRHLDEYEASALPTAVAQEKLERQRGALLLAIRDAIPEFVKLPNENVFQFTRSLEDVLVNASIWERDETGALRVAE
jgi:hypothetical protein